MAGVTRDIANRDYPRVEDAPTPAPRPIANYRVERITRGYALHVTFGAQ